MQAFRVTILGTPQSLRDLAPELGVEDDIPLFEVAQSSVLARPDTAPDDVIHELSDELSRLFREGRIAVYAGPWESDDRCVYRITATPLRKTASRASPSSARAETQPTPQAAEFRGSLAGRAFSRRSGA